MAKASVKSKPKPKSGAARTESSKATGTHLNRMPAVTPHLVVAGAAKAIDFYKKAFGAKELMRSRSSWNRRYVPGASSVTLPHR